MNPHQNSPELLPPAAAGWVSGVRLIKIHEKEKSSITNRSAGSIYPKKKSVLTSGATPESRFISLREVMRKDIQDQFDALLDAHAQKIAQERQTKAAKESNEDDFERAFKVRCDTSISSAFGQIGEYLKTKGIKTRVERTEERRGRDGKVEHQSAITLRLLIGSEERHYPEYEQPHLSLICDKIKQLVDVNESTTTLQAAGHSSTVASVRIEELTDEFLQQKVLVLLRDVLK
jgi:hypothetical protein